ncbi:MAG: hypothetical protein JNL22_06620 [Bacteroidales bacterium]|nr:hypothetical protein [Bacteroidales bacterium]
MDRGYGSPRQKIRRGPAQGCNEDSGSWVFFGIRDDLEQDDVFEKWFEAQGTSFFLQNPLNKKPKAAFRAAFGFMVKE